MKILFRIFIFALCLCVAAFSDVGAEEAPLSPAIDIIRGDSRLVKCCVGGERVNFSAGEFTDLVGADFSYLTLNTLPPVSSGVLKVAGVDAVPGQILSLSGLDLLSFLPAKDFEGSCSFGFTAAASGWESKELQCIIRFSETPQFAPIAVSAVLDTYKNVSVSKALGAYDPDGDSLDYAIEKYPENGTVSLKDGVATYTPKTGYCGKDSFSYYVCDDWGGKSQVAVATVTVKENDGGIYFADMAGESEHLAAIKLAEGEVMTYSLIGDSYYFAPLEKVSRIDYAVMLVFAAGIDVPQKLYPTNVFTDTKGQHRGKLLCLEAAVIGGLIKVEGESFRPNDPITVEEAVAMTERAFEDDAPTIGSAYFESADGQLTRKDAAVLLCAVYEEARAD